MIPMLRHHPVALLLLAVVVLAVGIGMREPAPPDEPRFVLAAKQMLDSGDWLLPRRGSEVYADKPAPFLWALAGASVLARGLGLHDGRIAFLLPSLLAALGSLWLVFDLARRLWNPRVAWHAGLALLVTVQFGLQARRAQIDMLLLALVTLSLWALLRHLLERRDPRLALLAGFAAGLGTVTKGVGFLPLLALLPWLLHQRLRAVGPLRLPVASFRPGLLAAGFAAGAMVWLGPLLLALLLQPAGPVRDYLAEILLRQTATRYLDPWHHLRPHWYYLQVIATLWLPGALLLPWLLPAWWRRLQRGDARYWLLLGWALLVLLFFSASPGKRGVYILPALPALCLAAAPLLPGLLRRAGVRGLLRAYIAVLALLLCGLGAAGLLDAASLSTRLAAERALTGTEARAVFSSMALTGATLAAMLLLGWRRPAATVLVATLVLWTGYAAGVLPALDASSSGRALMQRVARTIGADAELGLVAWREQLLLHAPPRSVDFGFEQPWDAQWTQAGAWLSARPHRRWLLVQADALGPCVDPAGVVIAGRSNRRDWLLVPGAAWRTIPASARVPGPPCSQPPTVSTLSGYHGPSPPGLPFGPAP